MYPSSAALGKINASIILPSLARTVNKLYIGCETVCANESRAELSSGYAECSQTWCTCAQISVSRRFFYQCFGGYYNYFQTSRNFQFLGNPISCKLRRFPPSPMIERMLRFKSLLGLIMLLMYFIQHNAANTLLG